jgi:sugar phosphate isomerase/epimerase
LDQRAERPQDQREIPIGLSTASVWPQPVSAGFAMAAELGYDGIEVMVWGDPTSQDLNMLRRCVREYGIPVLAVHAPCLLITQRVWSADPEERLRLAVDAAGELGAATVVIHPPFVWQRRYAANFAELVHKLEGSSDVAVAVENMFHVHPLGRVRSMSVSAFSPSVDPTDVGYQHYTLDLSHTSAAGMDALGMAARMGSGLKHVHLADGTGEPRDEHLVPGRGEQPCAELCDSLVSGGFTGQVVLEVNTRRARGPAQRARELAEALLFARLHLGR